MQCYNGGRSTAGGRDPDSKWVQWLAHSRRNNAGSMSGTSSSGFIVSPLSRSSSCMVDSKSNYSRSSATSYFAMLSTNKDISKDGISFFNHKQHGNDPFLAMRDMDSSWVAWFTERWNQRHVADVPDKMMQDKAYGPDQSFPNINKAISPSDIQQLQTHKRSLPHVPETTTVPNTATSTASALSSSEEPTFPLPTSSSNFLDSDINALDTFTDLLSNFDPAMPFDTTTAQADIIIAAPCATAELDDGDLTWLEEPQPVLSLNAGDASETSSPSKRSREEYHHGGCCTSEGEPIHNLENTTNKKRKVFHPWSNHLLEAS